MKSMIGIIPARLETERLYLRAFKPGDGGWYYSAGQRNRNHLAKYESDNVILAAKNCEEAEDIVCELADIWETRKSFFLAGFEKGTDEFVVQIYIGPVNVNLPEYQIGYFVDQCHEGKGYATEAVKAALTFTFENLGAYRVSLECDDTNARSWRVAERCGMVKEGHRRENKKNSDETYSGTMYYGLLRSEYKIFEG